MSNIVKVISKYLELEPVGNEYKACCPFHSEKSPSFTVVPDREFFYCFGCGVSGDAIEFVKTYKSLNFKQSLATVCEILNIDEKIYMREKEEKPQVLNKDKTTPMEIEDVKKFIGEIGYKSNNYRGIRDEISQFFGHLTKLDQNGNVLAQYYPETNDDGKVTGYKCRNHPKDFSYGKVGNIGSKSQLSGQVKFKGTGKYVLIVGGECYSPDTEILTENGWVNISQIPEDTKVMQVNNGIGEFVVPISKVKKDFDGNLLNYKSSQIDLLVTPNHKMVSVTGKGVEYTHSAIDGPNSRNHLFRKSVVSDKVDYDKLTDDQLRFIVAYSADSKVDIRKSGKRVAHFSFMKERKIQRLDKLLSDLGMTYTSYGKENRSWKCNRKYHTFNVTLEDWVPVKGIPVDWIHNLSLRQKKLVLDEIILWDGNFVKNRNSFEFSSKNLSEVEVVQCLALTSGYHAKIRKKTNQWGEWYVVLVSWTKKTASYQSVEYETVRYSGFVYCVTVPSGQIVVRRNGKALVCGNCDKAAAYQMLLDNQRKRETKGEAFAPIPVVSSTTGENSVKQVAAQYDFLNNYEFIIIGLDNDRPGREAAVKLAEVLPKDKVKIATWTGKDPNQMLLDKQEAQFVRDFYNAKEYVSSGISSSSDAIGGIDEFLTAPKIPLPPQMHRIQEKGRGGIRSTGAIVNIIGDTSIGKSFFSDTLFYYWIFNSPIVPTIISLERTKEELAIDIESLHLKKNLLWFKDGHDAVAYRNHPDVVPLLENLHTNEFGEPRYYIIDERDGGIDALKAQMKRAAVKHNSKLFILDPLTDFLRALGTEAQEDFMMWEKREKKNGYVFINILHTRKPPTDKDGKVRFVTEYDALGSSTFPQSADVNIVLNRDKMATDMITRNTTIVDIPKWRGGSTGRVDGGLYYDAETRQQYDKLDWLSSQVPPDVVPEYPELEKGGVFENVEDSTLEEYYNEG